MTRFSIASLFKNIKCISINTFFDRYLPYNHHRLLYIQSTANRNVNRMDFFDNVLQLHQMKFSMSIGASSRSVFIGSKVSFIWYQL